MLDVSLYEKADEILDFYSAIPLTEEKKASEKMKAFNRMQELRKLTAQYKIDNFEDEKESAITEKYGVYLC